MDDRLKELMQELGNAINESLSDSERIAASIGEIKQAGYDVFLVLEATIGFNKRDENTDEEDDSMEAESEIQEFKPATRSNGHRRITSSCVRSRSLSTKRSEISGIIRAAHGRLSRFFRPPHPN